MIRKACCSPQLGLVRIEDLLHVRLDGLEFLLTAHTASAPCGLRPVPAPPISYPEEQAGRLIVSPTCSVTYNPSTVATTRGKEKE